MSVVNRPLHATVETDIVKLFEWGRRERGLKKISIEN